MGRDLRPMFREGCGTVGSCAAQRDPPRSRALSYLQTPRVIAILLAFLLSGAGLALLLTGALGRETSAASGPLTGSPPSFTTAGDRWTLDQVLEIGRASCRERG